MELSREVRNLFRAISMPGITGRIDDKVKGAASFMERNEDDVYQVKDKDGLEAFLDSIGLPNSLRENGEGHHYLHNIAVYMLLKHINSRRNWHPVAEVSWPKKDILAVYEDKGEPLIFPDLDGAGIEVKIEAHPLALSSFLRQAHRFYSQDGAGKPFCLWIQGKVLYLPPSVANAHNGIISNLGYNPLDPSGDGKTEPKIGFNEYLEFLTEKPSLDMYILGRHGPFDRNTEFKF